ncbi:NtaA/DmoA family FMN-dependent monooxygenase [Microbacterium gilvum]|uniref:LLM class flavin-dependent oxidoreductase n=1 Tax=Microbacterium gilvum TaxID=1336204 RepID=A0ABP9AQT5_9MICO
MTAPKPIRLTLVEGFGPSSDSGLWNHPQYEQFLYRDPGYWVSLVKRLEAGGFDAIFFADTPNLGHEDPNVRRGILEGGWPGPRLDPAYLVPLLASVTTRLGFVITSSVTYDHPVQLTRKFSTLDHLTKGRIGWNIVTNNVRSAALNHSLADQLEHDTRYDRAEEFLSIAYEIWNRTWQDDAVVNDPAQGLFIDPDRVRAIDHEGEWFSVKGIPIVEPSPQRTPVLFQAGSSERGREFGATHAEAIYQNTYSLDETKFLVDDVRQRAQSKGRDPQTVKFFPRVIPVIGRTRAEAEDKYADYASYKEQDDATATLQRFLLTGGVDISQYGDDDRIDFSDLDVAAISTQQLGERLQLLSRQGTVLTKRQLIRDFASVFGASNTIVGTPTEIADYLEEYIDTTGADGFNIAYMIRNHSIDEFIEYVIPELRRRGRLDGRHGATLRERFTGAPGPRLRADHPGVRSRRD